MPPQLQLLDPPLAQRVMDDATSTTYCTAEGWGDACQIRPPPAMTVMQHDACMCTYTASAVVEAYHQ